MPVTEPVSPEPKDITLDGGIGNAFKEIGSTIEDAVTTSAKRFQDAKNLGSVNVNERIGSFDINSMQFAPDAVGHIVTRLPVEDREAGWMGELFGDAIPWVQQLTQFADVPGQLLAARLKAKTIADPDARRYAIRILDGIQKLPVEQQWDLWTYLHIRTKQGVAVAGRPGLGAETGAAEALALGEQAEAFAGVVEEATGVALNVEGSNLEAESGVNAYVGQGYVVDALNEMFPDFDIGERGETWTQEIETSFFQDFLLPVGEWGLKYESIQQMAALLDEVYQRAKNGEANLGTIGRDTLRLAGTFAAASGEIGFDIGGDITRRIPVVGEATADFAGRQARAAEAQIGKAVQPVLTYGFEPIGKDPNTGEPVYSLEDQRAIEARAGAFILLSGLAGQAAGTVIGKAGRRFKVARTATGKAAADAALAARRSVQRGGVLGTVAEVYRLPVRKITEVLDKGLRAVAKDPEKFFSKGIGGRQGRILLDTLDEARKAHPGTSQEAIDGQVGFVRQVYGDQVNERLVREMLKAPNRDVAKRLFVDTLLNPRAGSEAIRSLNKQRQALLTRLRELEVDAETRPARRADAEARLEAVKAEVDSATEVTPELQGRIRTALDEFRRVDGEEKEISRLRLADIDLDYRIKTTFDDSPMLRYPRQNIIRAAAKGAPTTRLSKILHGIFVRDARILDPGKLVDELPKYPELHVQGTVNAPPNAVQANANVLSTYMRRAGVPSRVVEERLGALTRVKSRAEFFDLVERQIFGQGGDIDNALPKSIDPELRNSIINLHDTAVESRTYSKVVDTVDTPYGVSRIERPVLGFEGRPGEFTPLPSRPTEFLNRLRLPDIELVIEADSLVSRGMSRIQRSGKVGGAGYQLTWKLPKFILRLSTLTLKPLVMLVRLPAMMTRIQLEQSLRIANLGYKPFKGIPNGVTLFPGGIPVPLTRGVRIGKSLFGEGGWRLLDPDPRFKDFTSPEATDMGMFMSEMLDDAPTERIVETTYEFRTGRRTPKVEHWEAYRAELEQAHADFIDRKLAQLDLDEDAFLDWLGKDFEASRYMAVEQMPEIKKAFEGRQLPEVDEALRPKRLEIENSFVELAGYTDEGHFYHVTRPEFFEGIRTKGLEPRNAPRGAWEDGGSDARVYLGRDAPTSSAMANIVGRGGADLKKMVLLRVREDAMPPTVERVGFPEAEVATNSPIPARDIEYLANDGVWRPLLEGRETVDPVRLWAQSRIQYLRQITREDPKFLETIGTGKSRVVSRLGSDFDSSGKSIRAKHDELVDKLDVIGVTMKEKLAERAPFSEVVALQNERLLAQKALDRLRRENPGALSDTKAIDLSDKARWRNHVREEWTAGRMELPDRLLVEKRLRGRQADGGWLDDMERVGQSISNVLYRPFKVLSYADKHGTRGSLFNQIYARHQAEFRSRGYDAKTADALAYARAGELTKDYMYDLTARTSAQRALADIMWFAPAWQEVMYTWLVKIPSEAYWPIGATSLALKGAGLIDVLSATGVLRENSNGEKVIVIPGMAGVIEKLTGLKVPEVIFGKLEGLNLITTGGGIPGLSTPANFAVGKAALKWGGVFKAISDVFQPYGPETSVLPQPITFFWEALFGSPPPFEFMSPERVKADWDRSFDLGIQYAYSELQEAGTEPPRPEDFGVKQDDGTWELSPTQQQAYEKANLAYITSLMDLSRRYAQGIAFVRLAGSTVAPMSLYTTSNERQEWENFWNKIIVPEGFGDDGFTDRQRDLIDDYVSNHPNSFAYTVFYRGQGEKVRDLPFAEDLDDSFYDSYYTGESRTLTPDEFSKKLMATEARRYYQSQLDTALRDISPDKDPWFLLTHGAEKKDALADYYEAWDRWLSLNPLSKALLDAQTALWEKNNDIPVESFEAERLGETIRLLRQISPMLTGEEGIRPDYLRDVTTQLGILYAEKGDFGAPNTPQEKALEWYFANVFEPYIEKTTPLYEQAQALTQQGLSVSHIYNRIREIQNEAMPKYQGQRVPPVEAVFFGNRNPEERKAAILSWQSRPINWLSDFQLEKAGYNVTPEISRFLTQVSEYDDKFWQRINEQNISFSSKEYDQMKAERVRFLTERAQALGPDVANIWRLNEAAPFVRMNAQGFGSEVPRWRDLSSTAEQITRRIEAEGLSPKSFSELATHQKIFFYRTLTNLREDNQAVDELFTRLSYSFPHPKGGYREGAALYEAVFFGNFNDQYIPYDVAQAARIAA